MDDKNIGPLPLTHTTLNRPRRPKRTQPGTRRVPVVLASPHGVDDNFDDFFVKLAKGSTTDDHHHDDHTTPASPHDDHTTPASPHDDHTTPASPLDDHTTPASPLDDHTTLASPLDHTTPASPLDDHTTLASPNDHHHDDHTTPASPNDHHTTPASPLDDHTTPASPLDDHTTPASPNDHHTTPASPHHHHTTPASPHHHTTPASPLWDDLSYSSKMTPASPRSSLDSTSSYPDQISEGLSPTDDYHLKLVQHSGIAQSLFFFNETYSALMGFSDDSALYSRRKSDPCNISLKKKDSLGAIGASQAADDNEEKDDDDSNDDGIINTETTTAIDNVHRNTKGSVYNTCSTFKLSSTLGSIYKPCSVEYLGSDTLDSRRFPLRKLIPNKPPRIFQYRSASSASINNSLSPVVPDKRPISAVLRPSMSEETRLIASPLASDIYCKKGQQENKTIGIGRKRGIGGGKARKGKGTRYDLPSDIKTMPDIKVTCSHGNKPSDLQERSRPNKPYRKCLSASDNLEKDQDPCPEHGATLNFYCVKCRVVICRDCTVVAHQQRDIHRVLDTPDALATLRTQVVKLLRHYSVLASLHASLARVYHKYFSMNPPVGDIPLGNRLVEGKALARVVEEAEVVVEYGRNLRVIREKLVEWEKGQHSWGDVIILASRCLLLANVTAPSDKVYLRMGDWIMPTAWIQLSHVLEPYLRNDSPKNHHNLSPSPAMRRKNKSASVLSNCSGAACFPDNSRHVVLSSLVPYIILNPDIRYFIRVSGYRNIDLTLVVVPVEEHAQEYIWRRQNNACKSPHLLRQDLFRPADDALTLMEKQLMMGGKHRSRLSTSSKLSSLSGSPTTQVVVKVSIPDIQVVGEGQGLPAAKGGVKKGDLIVDYNTKGKPVLSVVIRDMGDVPALRLGWVTSGLDGLQCLMDAEDIKRAEHSRIKAKILSSVRREEEAVYDITFGLDL
ncbi:hypothetical protein Pmani_007373 [Petrolisthes manimaculis]|uniref:B box-type domain-containing protein n=1 Tax=Petrolisthes manimaculis TaxID=1843537 RepID=A0AAE1Q928_9EUCA|nr:hypothetical protein Pmani_007373 [Petrolisthes manimaculis]